MLPWHLDQVCNQAQGTPTFTSILVISLLAWALGGRGGVSNPFTNLDSKSYLQAWSLSIQVGTASQVCTSVSRAICRSGPQSFPGNHEQILALIGWKGGELQAKSKAMSPGILRNEMHHIFENTIGAPKHSCVRQENRIWDTFYGVFCQWTMVAFRNPDEPTAIRRIVSETSPPRRCVCTVLYHWVQVTARWMHADYQNASCNLLAVWAAECLILLCSLKCSTKQLYMTMKGKQ